ncbi:MAG: YbaB/EbfC family nucleoid-associated protein [Phycisphaerae bacterium]
MLGNLGQIASLLKNSGKIQESMKQMQNRLAAARFVGEAGAGQVRATVDGKGEVVAVKIEQTLVIAGDVEMLEDLVTAAFRDAVARSREAMSSEMASMGNEFGMPNIGDMLKQMGQ